MNDEDAISRLPQAQLDAYDYDAPNSGSNRRLRTAGIMAGTTVFGTLALIAPFVVSRSPLPYMATPGYKVQRALQYISRQGHLRGVFVDLGSGDGEAVYQATRLGYSRAIGVELNWTLYALAQFRRLFFWSRDERSRSTFLCRNFFDFDVSAADTVMVFGVTPLMKPLSEKIARECNAGTYVLSYRFQLPIAIRLERDKGDGSSDALYANVVYDEEEMRIYKCLGDTSTKDAKKEELFIK
jgi:hypothetical protein